MICRSIDSGQRLLITQTAVCRKRRPALLAACARPADKVVSARKLSVRQPKEFTKRQLYAMLAEAVRNTG